MRRDTQWASQVFSAQAAATDPGTLPFSFVYGGRPSSELLGGWSATVEEDTPGDGMARRTLILTDPQTQLQIRAVADTYLDTGGVDWTLSFTNLGEQDTPLLEQVKALDLALPVGAKDRVVLHRLHGSTCAVHDWLPFDEIVRVGRPVTFTATPADDRGQGGGKSSQGASPFFNLEWQGGGLITAVGWSGQWQASVARPKAEQVSVQAGMERLRLTLHPGETIRSPRIMLLWWEGDDPAVGHNSFRQTMLAHIMPRVNGRPVPPPIVHLSTSFYEFNDSTEENTLSHLEPIKGLGFEYFWLDAYYTRDGFPNGMGHYGFPIERVEPHDRFPRGLRPIGDAAHAEGMGFVLWFEPERVAPGTLIAVEHPEWVIPPDGEGEWGKWGLFNLGLPDARRYMTDYLIAAIAAYGMDCLRIDFNIAPLPHWRYLDAQNPDRMGMAEIRYVEGFYAMWDEILATYPHLFIDNCASGGMRIDLETSARSIPLWRTDATIQPLFDLDFDQAALQNQVMTAGLSRYLPYHTSGMMGATPYWFRSGYNAGISFCEDCRPEDYPRELLREAIAEGKRLRKYYTGDFYALNDVTISPEAWCVMQYHLPGQGEGMVMAFRRHLSPYPTYECALQAIEPETDYEVTWAYGYEPSAPERVKGSQLCAMALTLPERAGSLVIEYRKVAQ
ncbi:MAG: glycoside hydrolase family 36 protein [Anaerolineae bacterium]